jgi:hypothetical protein
VSDVESLRQQLRERGYLSHGIERWFALDPWSSRTFWRELVTVAFKAAALLALFGVLPGVAIMLFRNFPLTVVETAELTLLYGAFWLAISFVFVVLLALIFKVRPELAVDTPRALLAVSLGGAALLSALTVIWWRGFETSSGTLELLVGSALILLFFLVATVIISAALLSFSIYELQRVPAIHQKPRGVPLTIAAAVLIMLLFLPAYASSERQAAAPPQVVVTPTTRKVALIAVDGLTNDIFRSRPALVSSFPFAAPVTTIPADSTAQRWASVGTGVATETHGVRAIEGVRLRGGRNLIQSVSRADSVLRSIAPALRLATRQPLPPTVRQRDYVWEILAGRGTPSLAVNWWMTDDARDGALTSIGPQSIFAAGAGDPIRIDATARQRFLREVDADSPQFATVYLPALDVIVNRLPLDQSTRVVRSMQALEGIAETVSAMRERGYETFLIGLPGDGQRGSGVFAAPALDFSNGPSAYSVAPTIYDLLGFPLSREMPGASLLQANDTGRDRVASYGSRSRDTGSVKVDEEYYESLRSLGYIR